MVEKYIVEGLNEIFNVSQSRKQDFLQKYPNAILQSEEKEIQKPKSTNWLDETWLGEVWNRGAQQASDTGEAADVLLAITKDDLNMDTVSEWVRANEEKASNYVESEKMKKFQEKYEAEGKTWTAFFRGIKKDPTLLPELLVQSYATMYGTVKDSEEAKIAGAAGFAAGAGLGAIPGGIVGAMGGLATSMEASLTLGELVREELEKQNKKFTDENVLALLQGPEGVKIRNRAIGRGVAIGAVETLSGGLAGKATTSILKAGKGTKLAATAAAAAGVGVEAIGGATGEIAGRAIAGQEMDVAEIGFEGITGTTTAPLTVGGSLLRYKPPVYKIGKEIVTYDKIKGFVETATDAEIAGANLSFENDLTGLDKLAYNKRLRARFGSIIDSKVSSVEDRDALIDLEIKRSEIKQKIKNQDTKSNQNVLKDIESQIDNITDKYKDVDITSEDVVARQEEATKVQEGFRESKFQANMEFAKKHSKLYGLEVEDNLTQEEIRSKYGDELAESLGGVIDNKIIINKDLAKKRTYGDNVANHELLHGIIKSSGQLNNISQKTIDDFLNIIGKDNAAKIQKRIDDNYDAEYMSENKDEYFTIFSDLISNEEVVFNDSLFTQVKDVVRRFFADLGYTNIDFETGRGAYNFLKDYNKSIHKGSLSKGVTKKATTVTFDEEKFSRDAKPGIDKLAINPDTDRKYTQQEWDSVGANRALDAIKEKRDDFRDKEGNPSGYLDGLIAAKYKIKNIPENFVEDVIGSPEFVNMIKRFNRGLRNTPSENDSLFGYIQGQLTFRADDEFKRVADKIAGPKIQADATTPEGAPRVQMADESDTTIRSIDEQEIKLRDDKVQDTIPEVKERKSKFRRELGIKAIGKGKVFKTVQTALKTSSPISDPKKFISTYEKTLADTLYDMMEKVLPDTNSVIKYRMAILESIPIDKLKKMQKELPSKDNNGNDFGNIFVKNHGRQSSQEVLTDFMYGLNQTGKNPRKKQLLPEMKKLWEKGAKGLKPAEAKKNKAGAEYYRKKAAGITIWERLPVDSNTWKTYVEKNYTGKRQVAKGSGTKGNNRIKILRESAIAIGKDATPENLTNEFIKDYIDINKLEGKMSIEDVRSKISDVVERPTDLKFSKSVDEVLNIRDLFELETKGIDKLLTKYNIASTFNLKTEDGREKFIKAIQEDLLPLMPKEFWFGDVDFIKSDELQKQLILMGDDFYSQYNLDIKKAKPLINKAIKNPGKNNANLKKVIRDLNIQHWGTAFTPSHDAYGNFSMSIKDGKLKNPKEAKAYNKFRHRLRELRNLPDSSFGKPISGIKDFSISSYSTMFRDSKTIESNKKAIKEWNKKVSTIHAEMWNRFNKVINKDNNKASIVGTYLKLVANDTSHWHKLGAQFVGYSKNIQGARVEYEHAMPATAAYLYLIDAALSESNFNTSYDLVIDNYKLIALDKAMDKKLTSVKLQRRMPTGWSVIDNNWWDRYFNPDVASVDGGIDPNSIIGIDGKTFAEMFNVNTDGSSTLPNYSKSLAQNKVDINLQKAIDNKYKYIKSEKARGMSTFDFDETVGVSENFVIAKKDKETKRIASSEWPVVGEQLAQEGWQFDFSDFNKVTKGKPGPLFQKMKNQIKKYGPKNVFILTARAPQSEQAIHDWLSDNDINIPRENVTGLGNSTGEAKANWMLEKFAEGYNDMYFVDDAITNVKAVKDVLEQLDIKSKVVQAEMKFSKSASENFNTILEESQGTKRSKVFSTAEAKRLGRNKNWFRMFVPPSAEDFKGLLYRFLGTGRQGDMHMKYFKLKLLDPFAKGIREWNAYKQRMSEEYKGLRRDMSDVTDSLNNKVPGTDFTVDSAIRVYLWKKAGFDIPGISTELQSKLLDYIGNNPETKIFADALGRITRTTEGYIKPNDNWALETIATDLNNVVNKIGRKQFLSQYLANVEAVFTPDNMNKIEALYGVEFREALENSLYRMENGTNRLQSNDRITNAFLGWINGSIGAIMFFNMRSALLQTISTVNFINWGDNNMFKAAKAFANQPQFWSDFAMLFNSDQLKQRRRGLQTDVSASELTNAFAEGGTTPFQKANAVIKYLLQIGFTPTQAADSFAISLGGASFYRNRFNTYKKQGLSDAKAKEKAMLDFQEIAEETQQSSREDLVSQQQSTSLGRLILAFQNVTMQYTRLTKKALSDLANGRGDAKTNISKIIYYGAVQNLVFGALQSALVFILFGHEEEKEKEDKKIQRVFNGALDSLLRGTGIYGAIVAAIKNTVLKYQEEKRKGWRKDRGNVLVEALQLSPPIGSKARKIYSAMKTEDYNPGVSKEIGPRIENPNLVAISNVVEGLTNVPVARIVKKANNVEEAVTGNHAMWQRVALMMGWSMWDVGVKDEELEEAKADAKARRTRKKKATQKRTRCTAIKTDGTRCKNTTKNKNKRCYAHQ